MLKIHSTKLSTVIALTLSTGVAQAAVVEMAVNGDFETGDYTGWDVFPQTGTNQIAPGNGSTFSGLSTLPSGPADNLIKQSNRLAGSIQPGDAITVTFDAKGNLGVSAVAQVIVFSEFTGGGATPTFFDFGLTDQWQSYTYNTSAGGDVGGGVTLALKVGCGAVPGCTADVNWDNVSFTADVLNPPSAVPVPAAAWLFGSGLLGLVGVARRKAAVKA